MQLTCVISVEARKQVGFHPFGQIGLVEFLVRIPDPRRLRYCFLARPAYQVPGVSAAWRRSSETRRKAASNTVMR